MEEQKKVLIDADFTEVQEAPQEIVADGGRETSVLERLVPPHDKKSREVTNEDVERVISEAKILYEICFDHTGVYRGAYAMHHSQIDDKDPLSMFVTVDRKIVINPKILGHSSYLVDSEEGCVTFIEKPEVTVQRWRKMDVEYVTIMVDPDDESKFKLSSVISEHLVGREAWVFQHEFDHGNASYIYPLDK